MTTLKQSIFIIIVFLCSGSFARAQENSAITRNKTYQGAEANEAHYRAIYQLDSNTPATIEKAIRNINNVLQDPRLRGKIEIELIAFSGGTEAFLKNGKYEEALKKLIDKGVIVAQCLNSLKERNLNKEALYDFIAYVPSGNGELVIRSAQGWTIIKP
ncbi:DsrE family protein [Olivibacter sp. CPCC 100613]|uniref:DsrE family protein n=1 Tax=Olivibacter sp. CPCC 100613 TaxID=3079931 RepID=UPI002FFD247E